MEPAIVVSDSESELSDGSRRPSRVPTADLSAAADGILNMRDGLRGNSLTPSGSMSVGLWDDGCNPGSGVGGFAKQSKSTRRQRAPKKQFVPIFDDYESGEPAMLGGAVDVARDLTNFPNFTYEAAAAGGSGAKYDKSGGARDSSPYTFNSAQLMQHSGDNDAPAADVGAATSRSIINTTYSFTGAELKQHAADLPASRRPDLTYSSRIGGADFSLMATGLEAARQIGGRVTAAQVRKGRADKRAAAASDAGTSKHSRMTVTEEELEILEDHLQCIIDGDGDLDLPTLAGMLGKSVRQVEVLLETKLSTKYVEALECLASRARQDAMLQEGLKAAQKAKIKELKKKINKPLAGMLLLGDVDKLRECVAKKMDPERVHKDLLAVASVFTCVCGGRIKFRESTFRLGEYWGGCSRYMATPRCEHKYKPVDVFRAYKEAKKGLDRPGRV